MCPRLTEHTAVTCPRWCPVGRPTLVHRALGKERKRHLELDRLGAELSHSSGANSSLDLCTPDFLMMTDGDIEAGNELNEEYSSLATSLSQQFGRVHPKSAQAGKIRRLVSQVLEDSQRDCEVVRGLDVDLSSLQRIVSRVSVGLRVAAVLGGVKVRGKILAVHDAVVLCRSAVLARILVLHLELCFAAAVKAAVWAQRVVGLPGSGSLRSGLSGFLKVAYLCGGAFVVVVIGFLTGTGFGGVTVRLFFTGGGDGIQRVTVFVLFCSGGTVVFVSSATHVVFRGYSVARPPLLEARALVVVDLSVGSGVVIAVWFLFSWPSPPSWAVYKYGAHTWL